MLKDKALEIIPKYGRTEAKVGLKVSKKNNIWNILQLILALYFKMLSVALPGLVLICIFFEETFLPCLCLLASLLLWETLQISYISHLFSLRQFRTVETIAISKSRDDGADMQYRNNQAARNPDQGLCNIFNTEICYRGCGEKISFLAII